MSDPREGAVTEAQKAVHILPEPPSANRWWRNVNGRMVTSRAAREYRKEIGYYFLGRAVKVDAPQPLGIHIDWYRSRKAGDLDKRLGVLLDALQGYLYDNDSQIVEINARRFDSPRRLERYGLSRARGRVYVTITPLAP